jgi:glycine oxidase
MADKPARAIPVPAQGQGGASGLDGAARAELLAPMTSLEGRVVKVAGAGVLGLSIAVELAEAGAAVTVFDPAPETSASAVAAGMLAPVFEAVLDPLARGHYPLLLAARDAWPAFAERTGIALDRGGAVYAGSRGEAVRQALAELGVASEARAAGLFVSEDWRVDAEASLERLRAAARARGVRFERQALDDPQGVDAIAATGWQPVSWAPESDAISAIKGQILKLDAGIGDGPVERRDGGYIAPGAGGGLLGATMQPGRTDREPDEAIRALVERTFPERAAGPSCGGEVRVGIRGATPDGLPLAGPSRSAGVWLAMGARRNGWLLAPLVAGMLRAYLAGEDPGPWAPALDARRFTAPDGTED